MAGKHWQTMPRSIIRDAIQSIKRNSLMSIAAVFSIMAALIILGIFLLLTINVSQATENIESNQQMQIFLSQDCTDEQRTAIESALQNNELVAKIDFESSDQALQNFSEELGQDSTLLDSFNETNNPMPASFLVEVKNPEDMESLKAFALQFEGQGVEYVKYGEDYFNALLSFNSFANTLSLIVFIVLSVISLFLIYNTIKLTVFARRKEIGIMKYVGATNAYIRAPFILEGMFLGIVAAVVALLSIRLCYYYILGILNGNVLMPMTTILATPDQVMGRLIFFFLLYGVVIGAVGSVFAIRKFLDV